MIRKKKVGRKIDLQKHGGELIDLSPDWKFIIICPHHGEITFDFNPFRRNGREALAAHMRDAIWSLRHELVGRTLKEFMASAVTRFWNFLDQLEDAGQCITRLNEIDDTIIKQFIAWLEMQVSATGKNKGHPWKVSSRVGAYLRIKSLLINRQRMVPEATNPNLRFPKNPFPRSNSLTSPRSPYSDEEVTRILAAINADLQLLDEQGSAALKPLQFLTVHTLAIALTTGRNPQSILDLRRDSLKVHPLQDREILVTEKRRGYSTHVTSYQKQKNGDVTQNSVSTIPKVVGDYIRIVLNFTAPLMQDAESRDRNYIMLFRVNQMQRKGQVVRFTTRKFNQTAEVFVGRHSLLDDHGSPLRINLARCRPTFGTKLYARTGDIRKVQQALGHSSPQITARHYVKPPAEAERNHTFVGQAMVGWATSSDESKAVEFAADGKIPLQEARDLLSGGYNTVIARCRNPFREGGDICGKYLSCFRCAQMVVFEDDLWRLYSFYNKLIFERAKISPADWLKIYGPIIVAIDTEIASQFDPLIVDEAKSKARITPHPAWARIHTINE